MGCFVFYLNYAQFINFKIHQQMLLSGVRWTYPLAVHDTNPDVGLAIIYYKYLLRY